MKKVSAILGLLLISSSVFAANVGGKTVTCSASVSGGELRGEVGLKPQSTVLEVLNDDMQVGNVTLEISPNKKLKLNIQLYTGAAGQSLDLNLKIKGTDVDVSGRQTSAGITLRDKYVSSIECHLQ